MSMKSIYGAAAVLFLVPVPFTAMAQDADADFTVHTHNEMAALLELDVEILQACMPGEPLENTTQHPNLDEIVGCIENIGIEVDSAAVNTAWRETRT